MSRKILGTMTALALLAVGASVAHGSSARGDVPQVRGPFVGTYTAKLTATQATTLGDVRMTGRFRLALRTNGTYTVANPLDPPTSGRFAVLPGKQLRFFKDEGCIAGGFERPKGGIYRWSVNGPKLTLRLVSEGACTGRTQSLAWVVWKRG